MAKGLTAGQTAFARRHASLTPELALSVAAGSGGRDGARQGLPGCSICSRRDVHTHPSARALPRPRPLPPAEKNAGEVEVRDALQARADYLCSIGDHAAAVEAYAAAEAKTAGVGPKMDLAFSQIRWVLGRGLRVTAGVQGAGPRGARDSGCAGCWAMGFFVGAVEPGSCDGPIVGLGCARVRACWQRLPNHRHVNSCPRPDHAGRPPPLLLCCSLELSRGDLRAVKAGLEKARGLCDKGGDWERKNKLKVGESTCQGHDMAGRQLRARALPMLHLGHPHSHRPWEAAAPCWRPHMRPYLCTGASGAGGDGSASLLHQCVHVPALEPVFSWFRPVRCTRQSSSWPPGSSSARQSCCWMPSPPSPGKGRGQGRLDAGVLHGPVAWAQCW